MSKPQLVTLDWETYYDSDYTLSKMTAEEYIRDPRFEIIGVSIKVGDNPARWGSASTDVIREKFRRIDWSNVVLLGHNMSEFDALILNHHIGVRPRAYACTLAMARALHGGKVSKSLGALAEMYGLPAKGHEVILAKGKRRADFTPQELAAYGGYCNRDCDIAYALYKILKAKLPAQEHRYISLLTKMFAEPRLVLDLEALKEYRGELLGKKELMLANCGLSAKELGSNAAFAAALIARGVDPPTKISKTTGKEAYAFAKTDEGMTELLEDSDPEIQVLAAARLGVKSTIEETRVERLIGIAERGMLPVPLLYGKTHTHRAAGGGKINLQNLGKRSPLRKAIMAPPGKKLVVVDSSNIELRVAHTLAGQTDTVTKLRNGADLYCDFAGDIYGRLITKEDKKERQHGKVGMLQLQYQSGAKAFRNSARAWDVHISGDESQKTVDAFRGKFTMIRRLWRRCQNALFDMRAGDSKFIDMWELCRTEQDAIILPSGMRINYFNLRQETHPDFGVQWVYDNKETRKPKRVYGGAITENLCQAIAREIVFEQMLEVEKKYGTYQDEGCGVVLTVHDELVAVVDEDDAEECLEFALAAMHEPPKWWSVVPIAAEGGIADRYGDAK